MEHIKDIVASLIGSLEEKQKKSGNTTIKEAWRDIVGEKIASHTKPTKVTNNVLYVCVDEATWAYELNQKYKKEMIENINAVIGAGLVKDIFFRVGDI
jgi:predicted nucleic acid-binding Zn ribbon protein